jgi:hypothetical protein
MYAPLGALQLNYISRTPESQSAPNDPVHPSMLYLPSPWAPGTPRPSSPGGRSVAHPALSNSTVFPEPLGPWDPETLEPRRAFSRPPGTLQLNCIP